MTVDRSSLSGKGWRAIAGRIALFSALLAGILTRGSAQTAIDPALTEAVKAFEKALREKDVERALLAWRFEGAAERAEEETGLREVFSGAQVVFTPDAPAVAADGETASVFGSLAQITEPRGAVEQWLLNWRKTPEGWRIVGKEVFGRIDGLVHLNLQTTGFVAAGQTIELEDFTLKMTEGTFFLNTPEAGPTALVFVGRGRVTFTPRPPTERGQMVIFAKSQVLEDEVSQAFLRLHPADLYRTLKPGTFVDDPQSASRLPRAREFFERNKGDAFALDSPMTGAPWWLLPGLGDAMIAFDSKRFGLLTLTLSSFEREGVNLFNRTTKRQICVYPRADASDSAGDEDSAFDVIHHDLSIALNPETFDLTGRDNLAIEIRSPVSSFRFHLDDDLVVRSIRSAEAGRHLFFRVRGQNTILVSMGQLSDSIGRLNLTVEYIGRLPAGTVESEILQAGTDPPLEEPMPVFIDPALIYSTRRFFYPRVGDDDYATSTLSVTVPAEWNVVSGGTRTESKERNARTVVYAETQPAKYVAFLVARLLPVARERTDGLSFDAYAQTRTRREGARAVLSLKSAVQFYTALFGPLPYSPLGMALVEAPVPGGHSPPGLLILQQRPALMTSTLRDDPATFYEIPGFFLAHELAHQWWGHGVTPRSYRDRWVAEGIAQYAAALWTRESQGEETFNRVLRKMAGWARRLTAAGPVDLGNRVGHIQNNAQAHRAVVYDKAALVLDMVRRLIGDEAFRKSLTRLQSEHRFAKVDSEMVRKAFETEGSVELDRLWETFVRSTTLPSVRLEASPAGPQIVVEGYTGPLPLVVRLGEQRLNLVVAGRLVIPGAQAGVKVEIDPDGIALASVEQ